MVRDKVLENGLPLQWQGLRHSQLSVPIRVIRGS